MILSNNLFLGLEIELEFKEHDEIHVYDFNHT